jgi:hypothetical protein
MSLALDRPPLLYRADIVTQRSQKQMNAIEAALAGQQQGEPLVVQTGQVAVNAADGLTFDQAWRGLEAWSLGDHRFLPPHVKVEIVSRNGDEIIKTVSTGRVDVPPQRQRATIRRDEHMVLAEYISGPWFIAVLGIDPRPDGFVMYITTVRSTRHPDYESLAEIAQRIGRAPPTAEQNLYRSLQVMKEMAAAGEI